MRQKFTELKHQEAKNRGFKRPVEFKIMYWMIWIQLSIITVLYWFSAIKIDYWATKDRKDDPTTEDGWYTLILVLLNYIPNILMTLVYAMI
jgi:hypothetical protein